MALKVIGIGDYAVSMDTQDSIKTYALGSCVSVIIYDTRSKIAGMVHIALPDSAVDKDKALTKPGHFADTGLPVLIEEMKKMGALKTNVWIKLVGGAKVMDPNSFFDIGKRNVLAIKKELWKSNMGPVKEDVGGDYSRTVSVSVETGEITISSGQNQWSL